MIPATFVRFLIVGAGNTAIGYGVILLLQLRFGMCALAANSLGYLVGFFVSYILNKRYTFRNRSSHRASVPAFVAAATVCYLFNLVVLQVAMEFLQLPATISQGIAVCAYTVSFYEVSRYVVFGKRDG